MIINTVGGGGGSAAPNLSYKKLYFSDRFQITGTTHGRATFTFPNEGRYYLAVAFCIQKVGQQSAKVQLNPADDPANFTYSDGITLTLIASGTTSGTYYPSFIVDVTVPNATLLIPTNVFSTATTSTGAYISFSADCWRVGSAANNVTMSVESRGAS